MCKIAPSNVMTSWNFTTPHATGLNVLRCFTPLVHSFQHTRSYYTVEQYCCCLLVYMCIYLPSVQLQRFPRYLQTHRLLLALHEQLWKPPIHWRKQVNNDWSFKNSQLHTVIPAGYIVKQFGMQVTLQSKSWMEPQLERTNKSSTRYHVTNPNFTVWSLSQWGTILSTHKNKATVQSTKYKT